MLSFEPTELSRGTRVAWVTQGVILYFESDLRSVWPTFVGAVQLLLQQPWASGLTIFRRWNEPAWQPWDPKQLPAFHKELQQQGSQRPFARYAIANGALFPTLSLDWQDVPPSLGKHPRASYLRLRLPLDTPARDLLELTRQLVRLLPVQQGRAGFFCHVHESNRKIGFDQAWAWARRYYGIEVIDTTRDTWDAVKGVVGINWLTVLGARWLQAPLAKVAFDEVKPPLVVYREGTGVIVQAGAQPTVGDQNHFEDLSAYSRASALIEPALIGQPTELSGMFNDHESTKIWMRRFLDPTAWQNSA